MATIHKYELRNYGVTEVRFPYGAQICRVDVQYGRVQVWVLLSTDEPYVVPYEFLVVGTGQHVPDGFVPVSTFFDGPYVLHACVRVGPIPRAVVPKREAEHV